MTEKPMPTDFTFALMQSAGIDPDDVIEASVEVDEYDSTSGNAMPTVTLEVIHRDGSTTTHRVQPTSFMSLAELHDTPANRAADRSERLAHHAMSVGRIALETGDPDDAQDAESAMHSIARMAARASLHGDTPSP